jgi:hypothetical protein
MLYSHPASNLAVSFDKSTSILKVEFTHKVSDANAHFIDNIQVMINGKSAVIQVLNSQESKESGAVIYKLSDAKSGDKITVTVNCNKGGKKSETITIK